MSEQRGTAPGSDSAESGVSGAPATELARGLSLGRYVVLERLGAGGMGVVYAAYDPQLDRKVAIKLLRSDRAFGGAGQRSQKLLQEAKDHAALSHPNVVTVHDVGAFLGQVFIAMEFVGGGTVGAWFEKSPPWRDVLRCFLQAGEGLAAAHSQNLIHRDFKPDNILLDGNGVPRVTDFGLARRGQVAAVAPSDVKPGARAAGTPGFQAPEQVRRGVVDARSDQFCFCLSLYLGLYGEPAFAKDLDLCAPLPPVRPAPAGSPVPGWVRRVVLKGLSEDPAERHPSMRELLTALAADPARGRRELLGRLGGLVVLGAVAFSTVLFFQRETPEQRAQRECLGRLDTDVESFWGGPRRAAIEASFRKASLAVGADTWARVESRLRPQVEQWETLSRSACLLALKDPRRACLEDNRKTLQSMSDLFASADLEVVDHALNTVIQEVTPASACQLTQTIVPAGPARSTASDERERLGLARARVLRAAGKDAEGIEEALKVVEDAQERGARHVEAEAMLLVGELYGKTPEAEDFLRGAAEVAERVEADGVRAKALIALTGFYSDRHQGPEARSADRQARAVVERLGTPPLLHASQLMAAAKLAGLDETTVEHDLEEALTIRAQLLPTGHPDVLRAQESLGNTLEDERGRTLLSEMLETRKTVLGADHPETARAHFNLGARLLREGDCQGALLQFETALQIRAQRATEATNRVRLGAAHDAVGHALACLERPADAEQHLSRAVVLLKEGAAPADDQRRSLEKLLEVMKSLRRSPAERSVFEEQLRKLEE